MTDGTYVHYSKLSECAKAAEIPCVQAWSPEDLGIDSACRTNFAAFEQSIKKTVCTLPPLGVVVTHFFVQQGLEGFVICFDDGSMLKIKTNWYFGLNKSLDKIKSCSERHLWISILKEEYDDIKCFLPPELRYTPWSSS